MMRRGPEWLSIEVKRLCGSAVSKLQIEHRFSKEIRCDGRRLVRGSFLSPAR
jgi:hypothetical protein